MRSSRSGASLNDSDVVVRLAAEPALTRIGASAEASIMAPVEVDLARGLKARRSGTRLTA